ncbi:ABC transporter ATP-binding protein [candidate division KSB1 bacterium]|nr:ABC transporter ATP-binding protein [candidate division KSB1 bacterium]
MSTRKIILTTKALCKSYVTEGGEIPVLKGIDLTVYAGEIVAIVGASGVGKSTLLHLLGALDRPSRGEVIVGGTPLSKLNDRALAEFRNRHLGFVFQFHHLLPEFTALENVMMPAMIAGGNGPALRERAVALLQEVNVQHRLTHRPGQLSGGEQQRVAVARALMNDPPIVLADEPSGNLDHVASENLHQLLWQLSRRDRRTFLIVTHNLELAQRADRVIELFDGRIKSIHESQNRHAMSGL